jgi:hypothetical protein
MLRTGAWEKCTKFTFSDYGFQIRILGGELWIFEVHRKVHKYTDSSRKS